MSSDNQTNRNSSTNESDKSALGGSNSGNLSSDFQSTDAASSGQNILPEAQGGTVTTQADKKVKNTRENANKI